MSDDDTVDESEEEESPNRVEPTPVPWTLELGGAQSTDGDVIGIFDIYTVTGYTRMFFDPDFGVEMSNYWHNVSVKLQAKRGKGGKKLFVPTMDVAHLDLSKLKGNGGGL